MTSIQTIDFSPFACTEAGVLRGQSPTEAQKLCAKQIDAACRSQGFVYLCNTGMPCGTIEEAFAAARGFFDMEEEKKLKFKQPVLGDYTGYGPFKKTRANTSRGADLLERYYMSEPALAKNEFTNSPAGFESACIAVWKAAVGDLSRRYAIALALAAGMPPSFFADRMAKRDQFNLVMNHYPPCDGLANGDDPNELLRIGEHADYGGFTLLFLGAGATGLQIKPVSDCTVGTAGDGWLDVQPPTAPDSVLVNTGQLMARWTNDAWRATAHRVIVPNAEVAMSHRYSIACFCDPDIDTMIETLPSFVSKGEQSRYPQPVEACEYKRHLAAKLLKIPITESGLTAPTGY